jgi:hypothetical protein
MRCRDGYYTWRNPINGRESGLGRDVAQAISEGERRNAVIGQPIKIIPDAGLTLQRILDKSMPLGATCAIYFLIAGGEVVYVGQSSNVYHRISQHIADGVILFDRYCIEPCDHSLLTVLETQYILQFKPFHNRTHHLRRVYAE